MGKTATKPPVAPLPPTHSPPSPLPLPMFAAASTTTPAADKSTTSTTTVTTVTTADGLSIYERYGNTQQPQPQLQANVVVLWTRMLSVTPVPSQRFQMKRAREQAGVVEREKGGKDKAAVACWKKRTFAQGVEEDTNALHFQSRLATFACSLPLVFFCDDLMIALCRHLKSDGESSSTAFSRQKPMGKL
jgi:hypothetical protein